MIKIDLLNPFKKKEDTQQMVQEERNFTHEENVVANATHPSGAEEQIFLEQQKERADLIKWQQDLAPEAIQLIHDLKREVMVGDDTWLTPAGIDPMTNDIFIIDLISFARPYLSKNLMMSNYTEDRILRNLQSTLWSLRVHLLQNRNKYGIAKTDMEYVVRLFKNFIDATPFRSLAQGEKKWLGTIGKRIETISTSPQPQKKSMFNLGG